jgi:hypothetical protein
MDENDTDEESREGQGTRNESLWSRVGAQRDGREVPERRT